MTHEKSNEGSVYTEGEIPDGAIVIPDYISRQEHDELVAMIRKCQHRLHRDYETGLSYRQFGTGQGLCSRLPKKVKPLMKRLKEDGHFENGPNYLQVMSYPSRIGVPMHKDNPEAGDTIAGISLLSSSVLDIRSETKLNIAGRLLLPPRSLYILNQEARHSWEHGISYGEDFEWGDESIPHEERMSLTFRKWVG